MSRDAPSINIMEHRSSTELSSAQISPRMHYRSRPVSVAIDPISLVISECISIMSEIRKRAPSPHSSVSAILGGSPNPIQLGPPSPVPRGGRKSSAQEPGEEAAREIGLTNRWGLRGKKGKSIQDNPLMASFGKLRHELSAAKDIRFFDAPSLLYPFLQIIQAKGTAAAITILALSALRKFLAYGFIGPESPRFPLAMQSLSAALTHCQFSDSGQMEVVLLMILNLMEDMMSGPGGAILSDESVCSMMERGLAICSQPRFSPVLRQTAEASMIRMCIMIFEDLKHLEAEAGEEADALDKQTNGDMDTVKMDPASTSADVAPRSPYPPRDETQLPEAVREDETARKSSSVEALRTSADNASGTESGPISHDDPAANTTGDAAGDATIDTDETESLDLRPYSLPSVRELFRVLVSFLDPHDKQYTSSMRIMALRIIHVALEVAGPSIARHPALAGIAEDQLCCHLFQLVRSDNMDILQESLVVAGTLLATCRSCLKLQQELFLSYLVACLHPSIDIPREPGIDPLLYAGIPQAPKLVKPPPSQTSSGRSTPVPVKDRQKLGMEGGARKPDARQAMVESIGVLSRMPTFMAELFVNYDCDEDRADLCEDMIGLLSRNALPDSATWSTTSVPPLCLDALLKYVQFLAERLHEDPVTVGFPEPLVLRERRRRKKIIIKGTSKFNESPKGGLGYLHAQGIIDDDRDPVAVATFLKGTTRVSKKILGEFLSKKGNEPILEAYLGLFDFSGKRVDEALRALLETFRLPGEAPLIARIVNAFCDEYFAHSMPAEVANKDAVYILSYAVIMLNTDQHNPNVKSSKRMTQEDFARNLRGQNGGQNFSAEYLQDIFDSIKSNEIILPEEHDNKHGFEYAWKELLLKTETAGDLIKCDTNIYDADMFATTWRPIVATLSYVFMSASDDAVFGRVIAGFDECARIAAKYNVTEALDQIVFCLSQMTTIAVELPFNTSLNTEVQAGGNSVMVSELAVKLGREVRPQLAMVVLFRVVTGNEHLIDTSWKYVIRIWLNLFANSLIPPFFSSPDESRLSIPIIPLQTPSQVIDRATRPPEAGFFSAFTSYISSYAADDPPEPSDEELESTLCTVDCVNACHMGDIFAHISALDADGLSTLVEALLDQLPAENTSGVIAVKTDVSPLASPNGHKAQTSTPIYDPTVVYILEFCTVLALRDETSLETLGRPVIDALQQIIRDATGQHLITVSRSAFYLLSLLHAGYEYDFVNVPVLLHTISHFSQELLTKSSTVVLRGLGLCIREPGRLRSEIMTSPDFWAILRSLGSHRESAQAVFDILERGTTGTPPAIMADNYEAAIALLNDFASASRHSVVSQQRSDQKQKKERVVKRSAESDEAVTRGIKAVTIIYNMTSRIPHLMNQSQLESSEAWSAYWLPIFKAMTTQCTNPCRDVRLLAFTSLQRTLLSPDLTCSDHKEWTAIFSEVLFPLIFRLLKPEVFSSDRDGMSEMRVQAASLLCKVFLQYLVLLSKWDGMLDLWVKIIDIMDRLMNSGQGDSLEEAVRENLKNVVLFMASSGYLVPPTTDRSKEQLWTETWKRIDRFLPDLRSDLTLEEPNPESGAGVAVQS